MDHNWLRDEAARLQCSFSDLTVLAIAIDPFNVGMPNRLTSAEWFAALYRQYGFGAGVHVRRIHYRLISQATPVLLPNGAPYENTNACYWKLAHASRDARYLGLVDIADFDDRRNRDTTINLLEFDGTAPELYIDDPDEIGFPAPPALRFAAPRIPQKYHTEIICEKSTVDDILLPLGERYEINVTACVGEISLTRCYEIVERAKASGRPVRILYISDFDPAGQGMPVACARKIEFLIRNNDLDLDIQLRPIVLTYERCQEYELPRTPLKETEHRAPGFERRFGEGATELDALEALYPGELDSILTREIMRYYDTSISADVDEIATDIIEEIDDINENVHDLYGDELWSLERDYVALEERRAALFERIEDSLRTEPDPSIDIEWPKPADGDEDDDALYDSRRSYLDQVARYKRHQGKSGNPPREYRKRILPETIALAKQLRADGISWRQLGETLAARGHVNGKGQPYAWTNLKRMVDGRVPPSRMPKKAA